MKKILLAILLAGCGLLLPVSPRTDGAAPPRTDGAAPPRVDGAAAGSKEISVAAGETRRAAVNAFNARLDIRGRLDESVFLLGGSLRLEGEVTGDVICIAANVEIARSARIGRDLIVIGGRLNRDAGARVDGRIYDVRSRRDLRQMASSLLPFFPESGGMTFFKVVKVFLWLILALLALAVFPAQVAQAAAMLGQAPLRHIGRGLLALLLFVLLLLACLLLSFVLIGIPLLVVLMAAFFLLLIFGRAAVFYAVGDRASRLLHIKPNAVAFLLLGVAVYAVLKFVPYVGGILLVVMDLLAIGTGVGFVLRRKKAAI
jgi:hypothetical protein